jgi:sec-independent protein translocase protein TatA
MGRLGPLEIILILGVALLVFGAGRISDIGKGLGEGIRNFKKGIRDDDEPKPKELPAGKKAERSVDEDDEDDESPAAKVVDKKSQKPA